MPAFQALSEKVSLVFSACVQDYTVQAAAFQECASVCLSWISTLHICITDAFSA